MGSRVLMTLDGVETVGLRVLMTLGEVETVGLKTVVMAPGIGLLVLLTALEGVETVG